MSAVTRTLVADAVKASRPKWDVKAYPYEPSNVPRDGAVVSVYRTDTAPAGDGLQLGDRVTVRLYGPLVDGDAAELNLDGLLDELMLALYRLPQWDRKTWTASRENFRNNTLAGWTVTGTIQHKDQYRSTLIEENN